MKLSCIDLIITNRPKSSQSFVTEETGLSDFHKMTLTLRKVFYKKQKPNIVTYRNYLLRTTILSLIDLKQLLMKLFRDMLPQKKRYVRANQALFMNRKINKEIMKRSRLRNKFLNTKSDIGRKAYNKQRNLCVSLIRSEKNNFFSNINTNDIADNKTFWKTVKLFFTDKIKTKSKITLIEKKTCLSRSSRGNSLRKNNFRRSGCSRSS